jgi:hypothetical protein
MKRRVLTDGRWFDEDKAERFKEDLRWNGSNHISRATGSQWEHEALFRTASGKWIINHWSQWQGGCDEYYEVSNEEAAAWLVANEYEPHKACVAEYEALEV